MDIVHGSKNLFKEQYYTDTRGYNTGREDCRQYQAEIMCISMTVYFQYLRIHQFVWARVLCGTRYYQYASLDCSGTIQKIHMREIEWAQGSGMMMKMTDFKAKWTSEKQIRCADAQWWFSNDSQSSLALVLWLSRRVIMVAERKRAKKKQNY